MVLTILLFFTLYVAPSERLLARLRLDLTGCRGDVLGILMDKIGTPFGLKPWFMRLLRWAFLARFFWASSGSFQTGGWEALRRGLDCSAGC